MPEREEGMDIDLRGMQAIANIENQSCFGCGDANPIGLGMRFHSDGRQVVSQLKVPSSMAGWDSIVHGGILSTILDEIMGWSVIGLLGMIGVTRTMTVEFLKPVRVEEQLTAIGTVSEDSIRQATVTGEIYAGKGVLSARATGQFATLEAQTAVRLGIMGPDYMERFRPVLLQARQWRQNRSDRFRDGEEG